MRRPISKSPFEDSVTRLMNISVFSGFSVDNEEDVNMFRALYEKFSAAAFDDGDLIIKEGDEGHELFILSKGAIKIFRNTQFGDEIAIADLDDSFDVFFGEAALVDQEQRSPALRPSR